MAMRVGLGGLAGACLLGTAALVGLNIATMNDFLPTDDVRALASAVSRGEDERTQEISDQILEQFPDLPSNRRIRITILGIAERWEEAIELAAKLEPGDKDTRRFLIATLGIADRWGAALVEMRRLEKDFPNVVTEVSWNNDFAWSLFMAQPEDPKAVKEGLKRVRRDLKRDPENRAYENTLAYGLYLDGKVLQAERKVADLMVGRDLEEARDDVFLHVLTLVALGRDDEAVAQYTEAVEVIPEGGALRVEAMAALEARGLLPKPSAPK
jgi:tetratricopeptide (TPR) repeat protein